MLVINRELVLHVSMKIDWLLFFCQVLLYLVEYMMNIVFLTGFSNQKIRLLKW